VADGGDLGWLVDSDVEPDHPVRAALEGESQGDAVFSRRRYERRRPESAREPEEGPWGCGMLIFVKCGAGRPHGAWQGSCKWHAKNSQTGCKKVCIEIAKCGFLRFLFGSDTVCRKFGGKLQQCDLKPFMPSSPDRSSFAHTICSHVQFR
jgi:hypothetical protein